VSSDPWLSGLLACALTVDAEAVRGALHARGLRTRSVPAGRAKGAWTCVTDRGTLAVVISGRGADAARQAASFWMPRARWLVLAEAGPGTGAAEPQQVVLDGDHDLKVLAQRGAAANQTPIHDGRVAAVPEPVLSQAARDTLAASGFAAWDANVDAWRQAASAVGGVTLVCHGVTTTVPDRERDLQQDVPEGATGRPWWRLAVACAVPGRRREQREADGRHREAVERAARCAVAALLGPA
jgi:hypothetical protein